MEAMWKGMDPNSAHQLWSRWTFLVHGKRIPLSAVKRNAARWLRSGFGKRDFREPYCPTTGLTGSGSDSRQLKPPKWVD